MTEYIVPARIPESTAKLLQQKSEMIFSYLNLDGVVRVDFIVEEDGNPVFLEVNTIPGMTETSLIPKAAAYEGIDFDHAVEAMLESVSLKL
jgi:D-alanine-D-alanine ligase